MTRWNRQRVFAVTAVAVAAVLGVGLLVSLTAHHEAAHATASTVFTVNVRTSGGQGDLNACNGAVDVTGIYHVRTIAEHDRCGGNAFPKSPGSIVHLTGVDAGTYRVDGIIAHLDGLKNTSADIPRGYDVVFQTCNTGYTDMTFTGLTRTN